MGYFDGLVATAFEEDADGRILFLPWGRLGPGYELPADDRTRVGRFIRRFFAVYLVALVAGLGTVGWPAGPGLMLLALLAWFAAARGFTRNRPAVADPPSVDRCAQSHRRARATGKPTLWMLEAVSLGFVASGVVLLFRCAWAPGLLGVAFFGAAAYAFARDLRRLRS